MKLPLLFLFIGLSGIVTNVLCSELPLACDMQQKHQQCTLHSSEVDSRRVVAIGDVHGSYNGLLDVLFQANVTKK